MKTLILIAMIGTAAAAGETNQVYLMDNDPTIKTVREIGKAQAGSVSLSDPALLDKASMTNCIKAWAKSGEICKVLGHQWSGSYVSILDTSARRSCFLCGRIERLRQPLPVWVQEDCK